MDLAQAISNRNRIASTSFGEEIYWMKGDTIYKGKAWPIIGSRVPFKNVSSLPLNTLLNTDELYSVTWHRSEDQEVSITTRFFHSPYELRRVYLGGGKVSF